MSDPATLLIADDDPGLRQSLERTLTREGYRVILASDGNAALERLQAGGVDLVLTDLKMPGLSGIELLRAVKAIASEVDVILLTAFGTVEEAVKAMKEGAYDFLTKPFQRAQLLRLIRQALERRDLIQQNRALQQRLDDLLQQGAVIGSSPAFRRMMTLLELADGGTLFLDEVSDLSAVTQPKILRVLQEGEFERLGGTKTLRVDVRIVAATNQGLAQMVREKRFREDLYYRLNVITMTVPPLRERSEDIRVLAQHFLRVYAAKNNRRLEGFTDDAIRRLEAYAWPGNVRELENVIERGVVLARGALMDVADLPEEIAGATPLPEGVLSVRIGTPLAEVEARLLEETLRATKGNKTLTAKLLGIDPTTVLRKLKRQDEQGEGDAAS